MSTKADVNVRPPRSRPGKRKLLRVAVISGLGLVAVLIGLGLYLNSGSFRETVRQRVIGELHQMTGGNGGGRVVYLEALHIAL